MVPRFRFCCFPLDANSFAMRLPVGFFQNANFPTHVINSYIFFSCMSRYNIKYGSAGNAELLVLTVPFIGN